MLALLLGGALVGAGLIIFALFAGLMHVLSREADLVVKLTRLEEENAGYAADNAVLRANLTRRKKPGIVRVPSQRKESA